MISVELGGLNETIRRINEYKVDVERKFNSLLRELTEHGAEIARTEVSAMGAIDTGELESSISGVFDLNTGVGAIKADSWYAMYVEFGTGIVGANSPHPDAQGWQYDVNGHGDKGWVYMGDDGNWHWTKGQKSRPFMYNAAKKLLDEASDIVKGAF
jgi:hypothetical protein